MDIRAERARAAGPRLVPPGARRPLLIAGPCVIESEALALRVAEGLAAAARAAGLVFVFKSSYLKDNRTTAGAFTGPGLGEGLRILAKVRTEVGVPVLTDVHAVEEVAPVAEVVDALQVPAFLCRQGRLLRACGATGRPVNVKKGQFLAPADMAHAVAKVREANPSAEILLTERGTSFGYRDLVVDMRAIALMRTLGAVVVFDATHALQHPGAGGDRRFARTLARAALAAGAQGIFAEVHPDPPRALCDASTQLALADAPAWIADWAAFGAFVAQREVGDAAVAGPDWPGLESGSERG
jgi:2-dehydro-3-deoxyphosphooctonate aldolase (KDO 8-P synthase)